MSYMTRGSPTLFPRHMPRLAMTGGLSLLSTPCPGPAVVVVREDHWHACTASRRAAAHRCQGRAHRAGVSCGRAAALYPIVGARSERCSSPSDESCTSDLCLTPDMTSSQWAVAIRTRSVGSGRTDERKKGVTLLGADVHRGQPAHRLLGSASFLVLSGM